MPSPAVHAQTTSHQRQSAGKWATQPTAPNSSCATKPPKHYKFILTSDRVVRPRERVVISGGAAMRAFVGLPRPDETDNHASESGASV